VASYHSNTEQKNGRDLDRSTLADWVGGQLSMWTKTQFEMAQFNSAATSGSLSTFNIAMLLIAS